MASLNSVMQKLYRAKHHFEELNAELLKYYSSNETVQMRTALGGGFSFGNVAPVPARFGLIAGDVLQCMRSSLDYLIWELVLANNQVPHQQNAFPISLTQADYKNEIAKRRRMGGVHASACAIVDALQPLNLPEDKRGGSPLALLDKLTNINKHRRVLLTNLQREIYNDSLQFPHIKSNVTATVGDGITHTVLSFGFFIAFDESVISGMEIGTALNIFGNYIGDEVLPLFKNFFEVT